MRPEVEGGGWNPAAFLMDPIPEDVAGSWGDVNEWYDKFNPSLGKWAIIAWNKFSGTDVSSAWAESLAGDWEEVAKLASALTNLGLFCENYSQAVSVQYGILDSNWDGEAAQAASGWFLTLSNALLAMKDNFEEAAKGFNEAALGVHECYETVKSGIETLADLAISIGVGLAATALASSTVVGGLIAGGATAAAVLTAISKVGVIKDAIEAATLLARGLIGTIATLVGPAGDFSIVTLPSSYDHRSVEA